MGRRKYKLRKQRRQQRGGTAWGSIRKEIRNRLMEEDPRCYWCGKVFSDRKNKYGVWLDGCPTIEHIVPLSEGGTDDEANLALACQLCNNTRQGGIPQHVLAEDQAHRFIFGEYPDRPFRKGSE